jgi:hypothetical protein
LRPQFEKRRENVTRTLFFSLSGAETETRIGKFFPLDDDAGRGAEKLISSALP